MKFNKGLLVVAFASIATNCFGMGVNDAVNNFAVVNPAGGPVRAISAEELAQILDLMAADANDFNSPAAVNLRALSAVVRAQLSGQTNLQTLGETSVFISLFGRGNAAAIAALEALVQGDQTQRQAAAAELKAMLSGAAASGAAASGAVVTPVADYVDVTTVGQYNQNALHRAMANADELRNVLSRARPSDVLAALAAQDINGRTPKDFLYVHQVEGRHELAKDLQNIFTQYGY